MKTLSSTIIKFPHFILILIHIFYSCQPTYTPNNSGKELNVNYCRQEQSLWCWAACTEMVIKYLRRGDTISQCDQAYSSMPQNACCTTNPCCYRQMDSECNHTNWPIFDQYGFSCKDTYTHSDYLSWEKMLVQIDSNRPMCLTYNWHGGGAHMIVMSGYKIVESDLYVSLLDPYSNYDPNYPYPPYRMVLHRMNRMDNFHTLGRCYYDIKSIN